MDKMTDDKLQIIYKNNKPHGIRNSGGLILFFPDITKYSGQEERYAKEIQEQFELANTLLQALTESHKGMFTEAICSYEKKYYHNEWIMVSSCGGYVKADNMGKYCSMCGRIIKN